MSTAPWRDPSSDHRSRPRLLLRGAAAAGALLLTLGACADASDSEQEADPSADVQRFYDQDLVFGACDGYATTATDETSFSSDPAFQCARLEVPLNYEEPAGRTAQIAVLKSPARGESTGSLVLNPGGPGGPGMGMAALTSTTLAGSPVSEKFDLVGFDPRGVGASTPTIHCFTDAETDAGDANTTLLVGEGQWTEDDTRRIADQCADGSGGADVLAHVGTRDAVRDMDILRAALGDEKLTYLGQSYGTRLGAVYAEMFPQNVRALVLDGAVDPQLGTAERRLTQYAGFQRSFDQMAAFCAGTPDCPLGNDPAEATRAFQDTLRPLIDRPIIAPDGRAMDFNTAFGAVSAGLYDAAAWPAIIKGIEEIQTGRADIFFVLIDAVAGRDENGHYANFNDALLAINCMDEERSTPEQQVDLREQIQQIAPVSDPGNGAAGARDACEFWPAEPTLGYPYADNIEGLPTTLTISVTGDPSTPFDAGVSLADTLGGAMLTVDGEQHTIASSGTSECVDAVVADYLIGLTVPAEDTRCAI
ncbi:alpha/beta fold hydrolase [Rhodococcoides yunnanense]|uniref:alpha/beta fold hydrolase n=1 Tax=Rhodococcoides yunnanense TaxID=278209 RepID=UPI00093345D1|nr:alpha/beta fold hydrolase [Rhodococcus yunnanensis]